MVSSSEAGSRLYDERTRPAGTTRTRSACWLAVEPLLEGRAGEGGMRPGQQRILLVEPSVGIVRVGGADDLDRVATTGGEQFCHLDEAFRAWTGDLRDRCRVRSGGRRVGDGGEVGERPGDGAGGDQLRAYVLHVADPVLPAPADDLGHELVELRRPQDAGRDRARQHRLLLDPFCGQVARGE